MLAIGENAGGNRVRAIRLNGGGAHQDGGSGGVVVHLDGGASLCRTGITSNGQLVVAGVFIGWVAGILGYRSKAWCIGDSRVDDPGAKAYGLAGVARGIDCLDGKRVAAIDQGAGGHGISAIGADNHGAHQYRGTGGIVIHLDGAVGFGGTGDGQLVVTGVAVVGVGGVLGYRDNHGGLRVDGVDGDIDRRGGRGNIACAVRGGSREGMGSIGKRAGRSDAPGAVAVDNGGADQAVAIVEGDGGAGFAGAVDGWLGVAGRAGRRGEDRRVGRGGIDGNHQWNALRGGIAGGVDRLAGDLVDAIGDGVGGEVPVAVAIDDGGTREGAIHINLDGVARIAEAGEAWGVVAGEVIGVGSPGVAGSDQVWHGGNRGRSGIDHHIVQRCGEWAGIARGIDIIGGEVVGTIRQRVGGGDGVAAIGADHGGADQVAIGVEVHGITGFTTGATEGRRGVVGEVVGAAVAGIAGGNQVWGAGRRVGCGGVHRHGKCLGRRTCGATRGAEYGGDGLGAIGKQACAKSVGGVAIGGGANGHAPNQVAAVRIEHHGANAYQGVAGVNLDKVTGLCGGCGIHNSLEHRGIVGGDVVGVGNAGIGGGGQVGRGR